MGTWVTDGCDLIYDKRAQHLNTKNSKGFACKLIDGIKLSRIIKNIKNLASKFDNFTSILLVAALEHS